MIRMVLPLFVSLGLSACAMDLMSPQPGGEAKVLHGLEVSITVEPGEVRQHEPFVVTLRVANPTSDTVRIVTAHGCLAVPNLILDGRRVPFEGTGWGCIAVLTTHTFAPGEVLSEAWDMRAALYAEHPGDVRGAPAPRGLYRVQAEFDTPVEEGSGRKPVVESSLRVR